MSAGVTRRYELRAYFAERLIETLRRCREMWDIAPLGTANKLFVLSGVWPGYTRLPGDAGAWLDAHVRVRITMVVDDA